MKTRWKVRKSRYLDRWVVFECLLNGQPFTCLAITDSWVAAMTTVEQELSTRG